jgi:hypothetical protein
MKRWPTLAGIALALVVALGASSGSEVAPILAASGFVYLGAAALEKREASWPLFFVTFVVIGSARFGLNVDPTWILLILAALFAVYGLVKGVVQPLGGLPLQTLAMVLVGVGAAVATIVNSDFGACVVAAGLLAHAGWDVYHHRINKVVSRSMAEFCAVLDSLLALAIVIITIRA